MKRIISFILLLAFLLPSLMAVEAMSDEPVHLSQPFLSEFVEISPGVVSSIGDLSRGYVATLSSDDYRPNALLIDAKKRLEQVSSTIKDKRLSENNDTETGLNQKLSNSIAILLTSADRFIGTDGPKGINDENFRTAIGNWKEGTRLFLEICDVVLQSNISSETKAQLIGTLKAEPFALRGEPYTGATIADFGGEYHYIFSVVPDSPAAVAGIQSGDVLHQQGNAFIESPYHSQVWRIIRNGEESPIQITPILYGFQNKPIVVGLTKVQNGSWVFGGSGASGMMEALMFAFLLRQPNVLPKLFNEADPNPAQAPALSEKENLDFVVSGKVTKYMARGEGNSGYSSSWPSAIHSLSNTDNYLQESATVAIYNRSGHSSETIDDSEEDLMSSYGINNLTIGRDDPSLFDYRKTMTKLMNELDRRLLSRFKPGETALAGGGTLVPRGLPIKLILQENLDSHNNHVGDQVLFRVAENVQSNGQTIIPIDTEAYGQIDEVVPARGMGRSGKLDVKGLYTTTADGKKVSITFKQADKPGSHAGWTWAGAVLLSPIFLFAKGKEAEFKKGLAVTSWLDEDVNVLSLEQKKALQYPRVSIIDGKEQSIKTSAFLFHAHVDNADKLTGIEVNGNPVDFMKGTAIEILVPIPIKAISLGEVPYALHLDDGTILKDSVKIVYESSAHPLHGKVIKSDGDGTFINLGSVNNLRAGDCFTVYTKSNLRDSSGKLIQSVENDKAYVYVSQIFEKAARVSMIQNTSGVAVRVNDLIR